jgi:hypothetical protein
MAPPRRRAPRARKIPKQNKMEVKKLLEREIRIRKDLVDFPLNALYYSGNLV